MIPKPIEEIEEIDLLSLRDNRVAEGKTIEYKRNLPGMADGDRKEFAKDVSSFANTAGGDLIYGVDEENGVPAGFPGIGEVNQDDVKVRLENMCRAGMEPRLSQLQLRFITVQGSTVLLIRVAKSWNSPHRASAAGHGHFYGRHDGGAFRLDVAELRTAFTAYQDVAERMRDFRSERLGKIYMDDTPVPIKSGCKLVLHLMPLSAFSTVVEAIDISLHRDRLRRFHPIASREGAYHDRINLEGVVTYTTSQDGRSRAYTQVHRSGIVEMLNVFTSRDGNRQLHSTYERLLVQALGTYLQEMQRLQVPPPIFLFLSFVNAKGYVFTVTHGIDEERTECERELIVLPEVVVPSYEGEAHTLLRPALDMVWNAFGYPHSENYDAQGNWRGN